MKRGIIFVAILISILSLNILSATVGADCTDDSDCDSGEICGTDDTCEEKTDEGSITVDDSTNQDTGLKNAQDCLKDKVKDDCSSSLEENIFTLLAIGKCKSEVLDDSKDSECWPEKSCTIKSTAQAILSLNERGTSTAKAEEWLLQQKATPPDIVWYLQVDTDKETSCDISYSGSTHTINVGSDKKLTGSGGTCLSISSDSYWLRVSSGNCYEQELEISCHEDFKTNLLYKKKTSSTIYVSDETHSSSAEGTTTEKINSFCFKEGNSCDYQGTLWAALALKEVNEEFSPYLPYLVTIADENEKHLPESFLYLLTGYDDFRSDLLLKQKSNKYWDESGDKFFDTALALLPFQSETLTEKENSIDWLLDVQGKDGCWDNGNIRNTAFVLYSVFGKSQVAGEVEEPDCKDAGYYCIHALDCSEAGGEILEKYDCPVGTSCCTLPKKQSTCSELDGEVCVSGETCSGRTEDTPGLNYGERCCIGGTCVEPTIQKSECELNNGTCRTTSCNDDEEEKDYACDYYGNSCCVKKEKPGIPWWIWLLAILIILVIIGIIFREKLRIFIFRAKSKFRKSPGPPRGPRGPTWPGIPSTAIPQRRTPMRRILPPARKSISRPRSPERPKQKSELDDVLKKLKDMGK